MEYLIIYLIGIADGVSKALFLIFIIFFVSSILSLPVFSEIYSFEVAISKLKKMLVIALSFFIMSVLVPSSKTLAAMFVIPPIINNGQLQELPSNVLEFINGYIKEQTELRRSSEEV